MKTLEYFIGVVDAIIEKLRYEEIYIEDEKEFYYEVSEHTIGWKVYMQWCIGYEPAKFQGDYYQPADDDEPQYDKEELYFAFDSSVSDVIREITQQLEFIQELDTPTILEHDNSDYLYDHEKDFQSCK